MNLDNLAGMLANKTRTPAERMWEVVDALKRSVGKGLLSAEEVKEAMFESGMEAVDLSADHEVDALLQANEKIERTLDEEGVAYYAFKSEYGGVVDAASLLEVVRTERGVRAKDVAECYEGCQEDIERFIVSGQVLASQHQATHEVWLFGREGSYLVELGGKAGEATVDDDRVSLVGVSKDLRAEIRRGDAICINGEWRRVASRVSRGDHQPKRAERPLSVSSTKDMHSANDYVDVFDEKQLPVAPSLEISPKGAMLFKFGCTNDVRAAWLETASGTPADAAALGRALVAADLGSSSQLQPRRRPTKRPGGKQEDATSTAPKRRRYNRVNHKITNRHLEGTVIGDILAANDERRNQHRKKEIG